jgi:hypothetical protein
MQMVTLKPDGVGWMHPDAAQQTGHSDGGRLIEQVYIHPNPDAARARTKKAMGLEPAAAGGHGRRRSRQRSSREPVSEARYGCVCSVMGRVTAALALLALLRGR